MSTIDLTGDAWERDVIESSERNHQGLVEFTANSLPDPASLPVGAEVVVDGAGVFQNNGVGFVSARNESLLKHANLRVLSGSLTNAANGGSGWTYHWAVAVEKSFSRFRILVCNNSTTVAPVYGPFKAAVTNAVTDLASARNNSATPVSITFSGSSTVTIPVCADPARPNYVWSDWIDLESVARLDGIDRPWLTVRGFVPVATSNYGAVGDNTQTWNATADGRGSWTIAQSGDLVTSNWANMVGSQNFGTTLILGVQTSSETGSHTIGAFGDSTFACTDKGANGWIPKMIDAVSGEMGIPMSCANFGFNGQTTTQYYNRWVDVADSLKLSVAIFEAYSTNNGASAAAITTAKGKVAAFLDDCSVKRIVPVLWIPLVSSALSLAQKQLIEAYRNEIRAYKNIIVIDCAAIVIDPVTLDYKSGVSDDGVHLNLTGLGMVQEHINSVCKNALYGSRFL